VNRTKQLCSVNVLAAVHSLSCKLPTGCCLWNSHCISPVWRW